MCAKTLLIDIETVVNILTRSLNGKTVYVRHVARGYYGFIVLFFFFSFLHESLCFHKLFVESRIEKVKNCISQEIKLNILSVKLIFICVTTCRTVIMA